MRQIDAGELQRNIAAMDTAGYEPKTIRNLWAIVRLIWDVALAHGYGDRTLPKPKLPRCSRKKPRYFRLGHEGNINAQPQNAYAVSYSLGTPTGPRAEP